MVTSGIGQRWAALVSASDEGRPSEMRPILDEVMALDEEERAEAVRSMVEAEYALPDAELQAFTLSRLRAWLAIAGEDMEAAKSLARGYDAAFDRMPGGAAMRRSTTVQTVARTSLSVEEVQGLFDLIPSIVRQIPRAVPPSTAGAAASSGQASMAAKKPFWKFW